MENSAIQKLLIKAYTYETHETNKTKQQTKYMQGVIEELCLTNTFAIEDIHTDFVIYMSLNQCMTNQIHQVGDRQ